MPYLIEELITGIPSHIFNTQIQSSLYFNVIILNVH